MSENDNIVMSRIAFERMQAKDEREESDLKVMPTLTVSSGSEFMEACLNADQSVLWSTLDELMDAVKMLQPRLYNATIDKLRS